MKKLTFYTEIAYIIGLLLLAFGTALTAYGGFGISAVVAPAYILHLFISQFLPFFSFGIAEYVLQAFILVLTMIILRKAKLSYLLSFCATIIYGLALDGSMSITAFFPDHIALRIGVYVIGVLVCCCAIALLFGCYFPPEAYELFVKELAAKIHQPSHKIKTFYDCGSLLLTIILSFAFFKMIRFDVVGIGTVVCAFVYGTIINLFQKLYGKIFVFKDKFPIRKHFEESEETK